MDSLGCLYILLSAHLCFCTPVPSFLSVEKAVQFLGRTRRAYNAFEELKKGNLERECVEELCNLEESREYFENDPETNYFYPRYLNCLTQYSGPSPATLNFHAGWRDCVNDIPNQCVPSPCHPVGTENCIDLSADYRCLCKNGWRGKNCATDINECEEGKASCDHVCINTDGSFHCRCNVGYHTELDLRSCTDDDECLRDPTLCGPNIVCENHPGYYTCRCPFGYSYNKIEQTCTDVDECRDLMPCEEICINTIGGYQCLCDGRAGHILSSDLKTCKPVMECINLELETLSTHLYIGPDAETNPVFLLTVKVPPNTSEVLAFDLRTFDPEGLVLFAERVRNTHSREDQRSEDDWLALSIKYGRLQLQASGPTGGGFIRGGPIVNDGFWTTIQLERTQKMIKVYVAQQRVLTLKLKNKPGVEAVKVYVGGLPPSAVIKDQMNPRLDACLRQWSWMGKEEPSSPLPPPGLGRLPCLQYVEPGTYFPGGHLAAFRLPNMNAPHHINPAWVIKIKMEFRAASETGVLLSVVNYNRDVLFSLALSNTVNNVLKTPLQSVTLSMGSNTILQSIPIETGPWDGAPAFCDDLWHRVYLHLSNHGVYLLVDGINATTPPRSVLSPAQAVPNTMSTAQLQLNTSATETDPITRGLVQLGAWLNETLSAYFGGIPNYVNLLDTPVSTFFHGCLREVSVNERLLNFDDSIGLAEGIRSHSCPMVEDYGE
uniref:growth arrest-specific protein 6-like n=1 Tax=Myxine glutinosa TaxID=7769 RepID=UPI00358E543E